MSQLKASYKEIWNIAYPLILGQIAWTAVGVTDTAFLGHYSEHALAAGGYSGMYYLLIMMLGFGFTRGSQILIARFLGEGNKHKAGEVFNNTLVTLLGSGIIITALVYITARPFFSLILKDEGIIDGCVVFIQWRILGLCANFISSAYVAFYSGIGKTSILMYSIGVMSILNIILNKVLIFGGYGFPELGIAGSGISSTIAEWVSVLIMFGGSFFKNRNKEFGLYRFRHYDLKMTKSMTETAFPLIMQSLIGLGGWFLFFSFIEKMGRDQLAVSNIIRQIFSLLGITVFTLGSTTNTVVSNLYGQKKFPEIKVAVKKLIVFSSGFTFVCCSLAFIFANPLLRFFTPEDHLISASYPVLYVVLIALMIMSVCNIYFNALISLGNTRIALIVEIAAMSLYIVYFYTLSKIPGISLPIMWTAEWVYWIIILILVLRFFKKQHLEIT